MVKTHIQVYPWRRCRSEVSLLVEFTIERRELAKGKNSEGLASDRRVENKEKQLSWLTSVEGARYRRETSTFGIAPLAYLAVVSSIHAWSTLTNGPPVLTLFRI